MVAGATGGVGSAVVQLAKRRGATVIAIVGENKLEAASVLEADQLITGEENPVDALGKESVDVVIDNVAGSGFEYMLEVLKRGGRYATSGAIAGPIVSLDMRTLYLKDIRLIGCTAWDEPVFPNLISYIERGEIIPLLAKQFDLKDIVEAQKEFTQKTHIGKFALIPPALTATQKSALAE